MICPTDIFNCEYFDDLKRRYQSGEINQDTVKASLLNLPEGRRIIAWLDRPVIQESTRNIHTMEKFDE